MKGTLILTASALMFASLAWGQCVTSVNTGGGNCVPPDAPGMPGYSQGNSAPPAQPAPKWADSWGAIAIDDRSGSAGTVTDRGSKSEAERDAKHDCSSKGSSSCKIVASYYNQCASVAWGSGSYGVATNASLDGAQEDAMQICGRRGTQCKIVYTGCSVAKRVR